MYILISSYNFMCKLCKFSNLHCKYISGSQKVRRNILKQQQTRRSLKLEDEDYWFVVATAHWNSTSLPLPQLCVR